MAPALRRRESAAAGIRRLGREEIEGLLADLGGVVGAEQIHSARKRGKMLRALLRLLRGGIDPALRRRENARWRDFARSLSSVRDAEVRLRTFTQLIGQTGRFSKVTGLLKSAVEEAHRAEFDRAKISRLKAVVQRGLKAWDGLPITGHGWLLLAPGLHAGYRAARRGRKQAEKNPGNESLHSWRKAVKTHWHHIKLFHHFHPGALKARARQLHELGERLGLDHDLAVLRVWIQEHAPRSLKQLDPLVTWRRHRLQREAFELGDRLFAKKPKVFAEHLHRWWRRRHV